MTEKNAIRVLAVDDQINWLNLVKAMLEAGGYQVSTASSYEEADSLLKVDRFDIVILDIRLVDSQRYNVQGMALLKQIKQSAPETKTVMLTGYPDPEHKDRALDKYKADAYIEKVPSGKPLDVDEFNRLVGHLLE